MSEGPATDDVEPVKPGDRVGRYEVGPIIGANRAGVVFRAHDPQLGRTVALEVLSASGDAVEKLRALATLRHPHVVTIYDTGVGPHGAWAVKEIVEGQTLAEWRRSQRTFAEIARIGLAIAEALASLHRSGLVHGGLDPSSVIIDAGGRVKLADLAFARCDPRSDQDAFFVILRDLFSVCGVRPRWLSDVIKRETFRSLDDVVRAIRRAKASASRRRAFLALAATVVVALTVQLRVELTRCPSRSITRAFAGARTVLAEKLGTDARAATVLARVDTLVQDDLAVSCEAPPRQRACVAQRSTELLESIRFGASQALSANAVATLLSHTIPARSCLAGDTAPVHPTLERARNLAALRAGRDQLAAVALERGDTLELRWIRAEALSLSGRRAEAIALADETAAAADVLGDPYSALTARALAVRATVRSGEGRVALDRAARVLHDVDAQGVRGQLRGFALLPCGEALVQAGDNAGGKAVLEDALAAYQAALGEHRYVADTYIALASIAEARGEFGELATLTRKARTIYETVLGADHPRLAPIFENLAYERQLFGDFPAAIALNARALALARSAAHPSAEDIARMQHNSARALFESGDERAALEHLAAARAHHVEAESIDAVIAADVELAELHFSAGRRSQAVTLLRALGSALDGHRSDGDAFLAVLEAITDERARAAAALAKLTGDRGDLVAARAMFVRGILDRDRCEASLAETRQRYTKLREVTSGERRLIEQTRCKGRTLTN